MNSGIETFDHFDIDPICPIGCGNLSQINLFPCNRIGCSNTGLDYLQVLRIDREHGFFGDFVQYSSILCKICFSIIHSHKLPILPIDDSPPLTFLDIFENSNNEIKECLNSHSIYKISHDKYIWKAQNISHEEIKLDCIECGETILYFKFLLENDFHETTECISTIRYITKKEYLSDPILWRF